MFDSGQNGIDFIALTTIPRVPFGSETMGTSNSS